MNWNGKFQNNLNCICGKIVLFDVIENIECDWGEHVVIQCPHCEESFSADKECPAFKNILELLEKNPTLYTDKEKSEYLVDSHPK